MRGACKITELLKIYQIVQKSSFWNKFCAQVFGKIDLGNLSS